MRVQSLSLTQFRNYDELTVDFSPGQNIILGKNGQGKTNLLEALYYLSHARSHRTATDRELIQTGAPFARISTMLGNHQYEGRLQLEALIQQDGPRLKTVFKANGNPLRSRSDVLGYLPTVSFFLPDLLLLRGNPDDRRRWLDAAIVQYDKRHLTYLNDFRKVRQHKNKLLKNPPEAISQEHLATWNAQFAAFGARVIASRLTYLTMIQDLAAVRYLELSDHQERLSFAYQSGVLSALPDGLRFTEVPAVEELEQVLAQQLTEKMMDEIRRGTCLVGPQRDDVRFYLDDMPADAYASQGQQRSIVLALKLTELACLTARLQEPPVLLLDDVMAELDPDRQRLLVEHIHPESQVFVTTTHAFGQTEFWQTFLGRAEFETVVFHVARGRLLRHDEVRA